MAALLKFPGRDAPIAERVTDPFLAMPLAAREEAQRCLSIIRPALTRISQQGVSIRAAAAWLAASFAEGEPSARTLARWLTQYQTGGIVALAPQYKGRPRQARGWEARAMHLFAQPQRPNYATVALWLRQEGFEDASEHLVRRYLKSLPSDASDTSRKRVGAHYYQQNIKPHVVRDSSVLPVGFVYEGDGHTCDVYVAHPATGRAYRPELTVWVDVRSHRVVGWWLSESESAETTLFSLSHALIGHDHTPSFVHCDVGSGFKARLMTDDVSGFLRRFDIAPMFALPGNAKGKGLIEGFFHWFEERCGKRFSTFCGHCRTDDALRHLRQRVEKGVVKLPSLVDYAQAVKDYFDFYNGNPQRGLDDLSPNDLWQTLERVPLEVPSVAVVRPRETRKVVRWSLALHGRTYRADELAQFEGREVLVEYSLHDDSLVWVFDEKGRFIVEAQLNEKMPWLSDSRIQDGLERGAAGQRKRLQVKLDEVDARSRKPISAASMLDALDAPAATPRAIEMPDSRSPIPALPMPAPAVSLQIVRPLDQAAHAATVAACEAAPVPMETQSQRFARCLQLSARRDAGLPLAEADAAWLAIYETTPDYTAARMVFEDFGSLSGVPNNNEGNP